MSASQQFAMRDEQLKSDLCAISDKVKGVVHDRSMKCLLGVWLFIRFERGEVRVQYPLCWSAVKLFDIVSLTGRGHTTDWKYFLFSNNMLMMLTNDGLYMVVNVVDSTEYSIFLHFQLFVNHDENEAKALAYKGRVGGR